MILTEKGRERAQRLDNSVSFRDVRDILCQVDRDVWPQVVVFLYLQKKYGVRKAQKMLETSYGVDPKTAKMLKEIIKKLVL
jgi:hypothetical protein